MEKTTAGKSGLKHFASLNSSETCFEKADLLSNLFAMANDEIILTDCDFNILERNYKIFTKKSDNVNNFFDLLKKRNLLEEIHFILKFSKGKSEKTSLRLILPEGKYIKTQISKRKQCGKLCGYLMVLTDYTQEIVRIREKEYFIDTLMHDLKTPARAEERALELLCEESLGTLNREQKQLLKEILTSSRYMVRMTDNVLAKLRLETEGLVLKKQMNSIKNTIESCINDLKYMLEASEQTIKVTSKITDDYFIYDEETIKLVLKNLLTNASEYSPKNSTIYVKITNLQQNIAISIRDEGKGIETEKIKTLLYNPESYNKRFKKVSAGLGLFISKKILEAHNGAIDIVSEINSGCEIVVKLPYKPSILTDSAAVE